MKDFYIVAIDGPSGVGKSTVSEEIAKKLSIDYLDTGAMYRAVTLYMLNNDIDVYNEKAVEDHLSFIRITFKENQIYLNGENVSSQIRKDSITKAVSPISGYAAVRQYLVSLQREIAQNKNIILDGRDIGTVVFPEADFKIYLTADPEIRAERRYKQSYTDSGYSLDYVLQTINNRDHFDKNRKISPLKAADDAIILDNSMWTVDETVDRIIEIIKGDRDE